MKHTIELTSAESLIVLHGLQLLIADNDIHITNRKIAQELYERIKNKCVEDLRGKE